MFTPKCGGCGHQVEVMPYFGNGIGIGCKSYANPMALWRRGNCPRATHITRAVAVPAQKVRVGQQKQRNSR